MAIYKAKLSDGRTVRIESDEPPTEDQVLSAVEDYTQQRKSEFATEKRGLERERTLGNILETAGDIGERAAYTVSQMNPATVARNVLRLPLTVGRAIGLQEPESYPPLATPEQIQGAVFGTEKKDEVTEGLKQFASEMIGAGIEPENVAGLAAGVAAPSLVARLFQSEMIQSLPHQIERLRQAKTTQEKVAAGAGLAAGVALPAAIEAGLAPRTAPIPPYAGGQIPMQRGAPAPKPEPPAPIERVTPEQAAAAAEEMSRPFEEVQPQPKGEPNAIQPEGAPILRPVRNEPVEGEGKVPAETRGRETDEGGGEAKLPPEAPKLPEEVTPPEAPKAPEKTPTSIKNAVVDQERSKRGLPPAMEPARRTFGTVWDQAMDKISKDSTYPDRLIIELSDKPRAITDIEDATLLHRQVELQNEYNRASEDFAAAVELGSPELVAEQSSRVSDLGDRLLNLYNVNKAVGTETGRGLNARKMLANEDFTLAKMQLDRRVANGGKPLTPSQMTAVVRLRDRIAKTQKAFDDYVAAAEKKIADLEAQKVLPKLTRESEREYPMDVRTKSLVERVVGAIEKEADAARARLKERGLIFGSGPLHELPNIRDYAIIGAAHIARGVLDFSQWSAAMVREFGENIQPHLQGIFDASNKYLDEQAGKSVSPKEAKAATKAVKDSVGKAQDVIKSIADKIKAEGTKDISPLVQKLAKILIARGVRQMEPLVDAVHRTLAEIDPGITRDEARAAIFGAGYEKPPKPKLDAEGERLSFEAAKAKGDWHRLLIEDKMERRTRLQKSIGMTGEILNTSRAVMTSFDLSAVLRQGGFVTLAHPVRAAKVFPAMFRALGLTPGSTLAGMKAAGAELFQGHPLRAAAAAAKTMGEYGRLAEHAVNLTIRNDPMFGLANRSGLYLSEHGHSLSKMEEAYMSRWAEKIPIVAGSQRAYTTFLNKLRFDSFKAMAEGLSKDGNLTAAESKAIANFVNVATGRATFGKEGSTFGNALTALNSIFFAPRYVASRFQLLGGQPFYRGSARTRSLIAGEYARFLIGVGVFYGLAKMAGATIETDPKSSDFGKAKIGNTRVDPLVGLQQITVAGARFGTGERKTAAGKMIPAKGKDVLMDFTRNKLAPIPGAAWDVRDIAVGEKPPPGHPTTYGGVALNLATPISVGDIYQAMLDQGVDKGTAIALLSILGMGVQTYDSTKKPSTK